MNVRRTAALAALSTAGLAFPAAAADILFLSCGDSGVDSLTQSVLQGLGHTVTIGPEYTAFDGTVNLGPFDVVYLVPSFNWSSGDMPEPGQIALLNFVSAGGGLVTGEWFSWKAWALSDFAVLNPALPIEPDGNYGFEAQMTFTQVTPDPVVNAGLPANILVPLTNVGGGTNSEIVARPGATVFYSGSTFPGSQALVGGTHGSGRIACFATLNANFELADANFSTLLSNVMNWAAGEATCYPDCDTSTGPGVLDIFDFLCFQNRYDAGSAYACDCDTTTGRGLCDIFDFLCFQNAYDAGCP